MGICGEPTYLILHVGMCGHATTVPGILLACIYNSVMISIGYVTICIKEHRRLMGILYIMS